MRVLHSQFLIAFKIQHVLHGCSFEIELYVHDLATVSEPIQWRNTTYNDVGSSSRSRVQLAACKPTILLIASNGSTWPRYLHVQLTQTHLL